MEAASIASSSSSSSCLLFRCKHQHPCSHIILRFFMLYIVYLGERQHDDADLVTASHHDMLTSILGSCNADHINSTVKGKIVFCFPPMFSPSAQLNTSTFLTAVVANGGRGLIWPLYNTNLLLGDNLAELNNTSFVPVDYEIAYRIWQYISNDDNPKAKISLTRTTVGSEVSAPRVAAFSSRGPSSIYPGVLKANGYIPKIADPFDYGAGFVNPTKAADPGLIYDISASNYLKFFNCMGGLGPQDNCTTARGSLADLNLPSIAIPNLRTFQTAVRTVTNVGQLENAVYKAFLEPPAGVEMAVEPPVLVFSKDRRVQSFKVTFKTTRKVQGDYTFGSLAWHDGGSHWVRIPIAVRIVIQDIYSKMS
ncbi:hypothetical protein ABZP36_003570 [Zizania latifolia]